MALHILPPLFSSLFRVFSYIFLKVIPTRLAAPGLPFLYISYLLSLAFCPLPVDNAPKESKQANGEPVKVVDKSRPPSLVASLLFSLKTRNYLPNALNIAINTLLFAASLDLALNPVFYPENAVAFARVGAVYPDSAKITVRFPPPVDVNVTRHDIRILYKEAESTFNVWKDGPVVSLEHANEWVNTTKLINLWPETIYEYSVSDVDRTILSPTQQFQTFPDPRLNLGSHFKFLVTSCMTPNFPYKGPQERLSIKGLDLLANYLSPQHLVVDIAETNKTTTVEGPASEKNATVEQVIVAEAFPEAPVSNLHKFMLFIGDFIYADVPIYFGNNPDWYSRLYRRNYASPSFQKILKQLPLLFAYDDHEIINNYGGEGVDLPPYTNATRSFDIYNGDSNYDPIETGNHYFNFSYGDTAFFVLDTRRYRSNIKTTAAGARTMLGTAQLEVLHKWLSNVNQTSTFKFIVSSVPFTSLWQHDALKDSWAGYEQEKAQILEAIQTVPNVVVLSGDRHEFAAVEFATLDAGLHVVREFSTSPLNMFYIPFLRTLKMDSDELVMQVRNEMRSTDAGPVMETYHDFVPKEKVLKYIPVGNVKWSSIEVDTRNETRPVLRLEVIIDGKPAYHLETIGTPVGRHSSKALITVPFGFKHFLEKLGFQPKHWF